MYTQDACVGELIMQRNIKLFFLNFHAASINLLIGDGSQIPIEAWCLTAQKICVCYFHFIKFLIII